MGDHWKSLAQKLGAPGMDDPSTSNDEAAAVSETAETTAPPATPNEEFVEPLSEVMTPAAEPEVVDEKPRKRSSWEALASMFNIQVDRTPPPEPAAPPKPAPTPVAPARESRPAAQREKPRFNEPRRGRENAPESEPRLQVFQESSDSDTNPALESMFADVPRGDVDSWKKTPRVVDDISWDDDVSSSVEKEIEPEFISEAFSGDIDLPREDVAETSERPARRRRRRRGPRRPEGTEAAPRSDRDTNRELDDVESVVPGDDYAEPDSFEADLSEAAEPVGSADPERRSSRRRRRGRKRPSDDAVGPTRTDDGELNAERASERVGDRPERLPRTDRGSDRMDRPERTSERPERSAERPERSERSPDRGRGRRERSPEVGDRNPDRSAERTVDRSSDRSADRDDAPRSDRGDRGDGRRDKRTERSEPRGDRPPRVREERPLPPRSDIEEHDDADDLEDLDSHDSGDKHRNIPSWADSLQAIIEGNMENHKRNDNRGGPPRGRPRPRR